MKLARIGPPGHEKPVVMASETTFLDVSPEYRDFDPEFFRHNGPAEVRRGVDEGRFKPLAEPSPRFGACIARPSKIVCVGLNYVDHTAEAGMRPPMEPVTFLKAPSSLCGPHDDLILPIGGYKTDWEVELGIVIGQTVRYAPDEQTALSSIAGICLSNDVSERAFQLEHGDQWSKGKCCETFNPLGPWLLTYDPSLDLSSLQLELRVNGSRQQCAVTKDMVFSVAEIIRYVSQFMVLEPGDLINTGTPPGTALGMPIPSYLREGDLVEASITGLGEQRQVCVRASC